METPVRIGRGHMLLLALQVPMIVTAMVRRLRGPSESMLNKGYEHRKPADADLVVSYKVLLSGELAAVTPLHPYPEGRWPAPGPDAAWDVLPGESATKSESTMGGTGWADPGPDAVWVAVPDVAVSGIREQTRQKTLLVMLQEADSYRVVWLGWSQSKRRWLRVDSRAQRLSTTPW